MVMSASVLLPPSTRLLIGHEMNSLLRSMSVTSRSGAHIRTYLAAVAPPKPAPITTTRPALAPPPVPAQPATAATPAPADIHLMNSRLVIVMAALLNIRRAPQAP